MRTYIASSNVKFASEMKAQPSRMHLVQVVSKETLRHASVAESAHIPVGRRTCVQIDGDLGASARGKWHSLFAVIILGSCSSTLSTAFDSLEAERASDAATTT